MLPGATDRVLPVLDLDFHSVSSISGTHYPRAVGLEGCEDEPLEWETCLGAQQAVCRRSVQFAFTWKASGPDNDHMALHLNPGNSTRESHLPSRKASPTYPALRLYGAFSAL